MPRSIESSIEIRASLPRVYEAATHFDRLPCYLVDVAEVHQVRPGRLCGHFSIPGRTIEWEADVLAEPERRIAWSSRTAPETGGSIEFDPLPDATRVRVRITYDPAASPPPGAEPPYLVGDRLRSALEAFREQFEPLGRGNPTSPTVSIAAHRGTSP